MKETRKGKTMKLLKKLTAIIILLSMLITLNSPIISYAEGEIGTNTTGESTTGEQTEEIGTEYEIKEEVWDISKNEDGSVIAKWTIEDMAITISGSGEMKDWSSSFSTENWHSSKLKNLIQIVKINNGVTSIGDRAFEECRNLTSVIIPNSVTSIGRYAFYNCSSLTSINIPEGVINIYNEAFRGCSSLTSINIPKSVVSITGSVFSECDSLVDINLVENNKNYVTIDGVLYNKNKTKQICNPPEKI